MAEGEVPIKALDIPEPEENGEPASPIPRRKKSQQTNGHSQNGTTNGINGTVSAVIEVDSAAKKRGATEALGEDSSLSKRLKIKFSSEEKGIIMIDDADGVILIDDD